MIRARDRLVDLVVAVISVFVAPILYIAARKRWTLRLSRLLHDWIGVTIVQNHYYEPVLTGRDLRLTGDAPRYLPGINLDIGRQHAVLQTFCYAEELANLDGVEVGGRVYRYRNQDSMFAEGDADALYSFVRLLKPRSVIEIGCGQSSLVIQAALRRNKSEDPRYDPRHTCFEPFHNGWLNDIGANFQARRIEDVDLEIFRSLAENDIVFIDSSHVLKAQGDVEHEFLRILPSLPVGVYVHIHDVFTPRDYPDAFKRYDRRFWTEQYVLEAFLSCNPSYEVVLALNDLHKRRDELLYTRLPVLKTMPDKNPGSFWIRRIG